MKRSPIPMVWVRRGTQAAFLLLFLFLFRKTDYAGEDAIPYAVNLFFRWDPLLAASATLAARQIIPLVLPALVLAAATLVLGRFFCGWVCPLGTLLDAAHPLIGGRPAGDRRAVAQRQVRPAGGHPDAGPCSASRSPACSTRSASWCAA